MKLVHYLNGAFVTEEKLLISPMDLGFIRGYAVFDFFRTYNKHRPFMFDYHIERLFNSAESIGLTLPWTQDDVKDIIRQTLDKNAKAKEYAIRVIISGGVAKAAKPTMIVVMDDVMSFPTSLYEEGITVFTVEHKRYKPASKTVQYVEAIQRMPEMAAGGFGEMLYVDNGYVLEGAYSNFFCVIDNTLVTAKNNVLQGITRRVITEKLDPSVPVEIRDFTLKELESATEAFICVSGKGIVPVVKVDDHMIGNGKPGPITQDLIEKLGTFIASNKW